MKQNLLRLLFSTLFIADMTTAHAQTPAETQMNTLSLNGMNVLRTFDNRHTGVKGGVMLMEAFVPGTIMMPRGERIPLDEMNYDAFNDELVVMRNDQAMSVTTTMVAGFVLRQGTDTLHFDRVVRPEGKIGFAQRLNSSGRIVLYKRLYKTLLEPDNKGAYNAGRSDAEFIPGKKYFVQKKNQPLQEIRTKKSFLQLFPENEEALESFIKKEKIGFKEDEDLIKLFNYLNQIGG